MITSSTSPGFMRALTTAYLIAMAPSCIAEKLNSDFPYLPIGVRQALTITAFGMFHLRFTQGRQDSLSTFLT